MQNIPLERLFEEAQKYGRIFLHQSDDGTFSCTISFNTIKHIKLDAKSGYKHATIKSAVVAAIKNAVVIVESMKNSKEVDTLGTVELIGVTTRGLINEIHSS